VLCASALSSLVLPVFAAQSSTASTPSHPATKNKKKSSPSKTHRQLAPEPARIVEIQQALAREGFYQGEPTGKWDDSTVTAMKNFQQAKGLQPTGKIEALSLQKLGLGSPVAGLAPPTRPSQPSAVPPQSDSQKKP
jgi:peptidoglycan hydrolase-like protein with peptidoglycan-binding domain